MKKIVRFTESDLTRIVKRIINEDMMDVSSDSEYYKSRKRDVNIPFDDLSMLVQLANRFCYGKENFPNCKRVSEINKSYNLYM